MTDHPNRSAGSERALTGKDFYDMSGPDLLAYCGADASKWAEAFCKIKEAQGWGASDIDEGLMITWFANAIEHSEQARHTPDDAQPAQVPKAWFCFVPSPPGEEEPLRIRAWTTDADRAKRIGEVIGREFEPLYVSQPSPAATVEPARPSAWICTSRTEAFVTQDQDAVRAFMDRDNGWTVVPLYMRSALDLAAPQNSAERPPSSDAVEAGADTHSSAVSDLADWSSLPRDLYVTSVKSDGIVFEVTCCSVPMAIGPEVRYSQVVLNEPQTARKTEPRFYIDHGMIHDRVTGKHVTTDGKPPFEDGIEETCDLLNGLAATQHGDKDAIIERLGMMVSQLHERIEQLRSQPQAAPIPPDTEAELLHSIELLMAQCEQLRGEYQRGLDDAIRTIQAGRDDWSSGEDIGKITNALLGVAEARIADLSRATTSLTRPVPQSSSVPQEEDCGCIGAVIGQHERSCPLSRPNS